MAANPYLYLKRHNQQLTASVPGLTSEKYMEGFERAESLVNMMVGLSNEVARLAIADGIEALKKAGKYKQTPKQLANETFKAQEAYEARHNQNFGDRMKLWLDYLDDVEAEYRPHIFQIYMSIKQLLDRHRQSQSELKARLECGRICATAACAQFDTIMADLLENYGVDYTPHFDAGRYTKPLYWWTRLCEMFLKTDDPDDFISLTQDPNCKMAFDILCRKLNDATMLNRVGKRAIEQNLEVASKYTTEDDLRELGVI